MNDKIKNILIGAVSGGIAGWLAANSNSTPTPSAALTEKKTEISPFIIASDWREISQTLAVDYWNVFNFEIPNNVIVSELYPEYYNIDGSIVTSSIAAWACKSAAGNYAVGIMSDTPVTLTVRLIAKCFIIN